VFVAVIVGPVPNPDPIVGNVVDAIKLPPIDNDDKFAAVFVIVPPVIAGVVIVGEVIVLLANGGLK
jgi:hypothetical protein